MGSAPPATSLMESGGVLAETALRRRRCCDVGADEESVDEDGADEDGHGVSTRGSTATKDVRRVAICKPTPMASTLASFMCAGTPTAASA